MWSFSLGLIRTVLCLQNRARYNSYIDIVMKTAVNVIKMEEKIRKSIPRIDPETGLDRLSNDTLLSESINHAVELVKSGNLLAEVKNR